jgi:predicted metalloprotease
MRFRRRARLDPGQVTDARGQRMGAGGLALGGGGLGIVGVIIFLLITFLGGGGGLGDLTSLDQQQVGQGDTPSEVSQECRTGEDANEREDCRIVGVVNSVQKFWDETFQRSNEQYPYANTKFFTDQVNTGCGVASSQVGPFYCPADQLVYIDLTFFDTLKQQFGAQGGLFVDAYVLAHEYGHHVQNLLGTNGQVTPGETGPTSGTVRLELQADCYAGTWANHAETVPDESGAPLIEDINSDDISRALDAAARIGDDFIQENLGSGRVDQDAFTHGSSEQRQRWFTTGYETGDPNQCDTFSTDDLG